MSIIKKKGYCTLCRSRCGTINYVNKDQLIKVEPDLSHPTGSAICMKGRAAPELVHSPNRILHPMKRVNAKTEIPPKWERISWDEALTTISSTLAEIKSTNGAESVAFGVTTPSGTPISDNIDWIERFIRAFGSPNTCYGTEVCNWHKDFAHRFTFGCGMPTADYANADTVMLWGHNPTNTWLSQSNAINLGLSNGAKLLVIDPQKTALAAKADVWLRVKPGTDFILAMGLVHLLIDGGDFDHEFIRCWTNAPFLVRSDTKALLRSDECKGINQGDQATDKSADHLVWDNHKMALHTYDADNSVSKELADNFALTGQFDITLHSGKTVMCEPVFGLLTQAAQSFTPHYVESITGVGKSQLIDAANLLSHHKKVAYHAWTGIGQQINATQTERAVAILYALTGSFDKKGGNRAYIQPPFSPVNGLDMIKKPQRDKALGLKARPIGPASQGWINIRDLYQTILSEAPYKIRAFFGFGTNFLASQGDINLGQKAFQQLEFHVHCDLFETPTSNYADILLPINTPWEREALKIGFEINQDAVSHIQLRQKMIEPLGESKSDGEIVFALAKKLNMDKEFFDGSMESAWNYMLNPLGLTTEQLRENPQGIKYPQVQPTQKYSQVTQTKIRGFDTDSQRVELYSETLLNAGYPPLPKIKDNHLNLNNSADEFSFLLASVKSGYYCHSQHRSLVSLRKRSPLPKATISAALAQAKNITNGDWIIISTPEGKAQFCASVDTAIDDWVIIAEFGWWQACHELGFSSYPISGQALEQLSTNFNQLISAKLSDEVSGSVPMRSYPCNVELHPNNPNKNGWAGRIAFEVIDKKLFADNVMEITLIAKDNRSLPDYAPGQHITLSIEQADGSQLIRAYSLTGAAKEHHRQVYTIAVRYQSWVDNNNVLNKGKMSSYLHHKIQIGSSVFVGMPSGSFVLPTYINYPVVLFAGGIGITPFMSYLRSVNPNTMPKIWLYYANRNSKTHAFASELKVLQANLPKLHIINYYNEPLDTDIKGVDFDKQEFVSAAVVSDKLIQQRTRFYICGPDAMRKTIATQLVGRGVPTFDIFYEVFRSPIKPPNNVNQSFKVSFINSDINDKKWTPSVGSLLDFAEKLNIKANSGCRVGQCESCAVRIISGSVTHLHGQDPDDPDVCLACQAVPTSDLKVEL